MTVTSVEELLALLEKSKLLSLEQLDEARALSQECGDAVGLGAELTEAELLTPWQAAQLVAGGTNFFIGNYKMLRLLGQGGMGKVYLGQHATLGRLAALKMISKKVRREPEAIERFLSEARTVAALDHPNIVQAYSVDNVGGRFCLVMEFIDGQDLKQLIAAEGPLDYRVAVDYIRQAADGLEHGHSRNIIHCDIKPSNLIVNQQGTVKIVDMGLAQLQGPAETRATTVSDGRVLGSVDYLAPELAMGHKEFNQQVDIYSLGCTFYFLLTGQPPFPGGLLHEKLMKHQSMQPESIKELRSNVPKSVVEVCEKMMAKKPDDRFQSAAELSKKLKEFPTLQRRVRPVLLKQSHSQDYDPSQSPDDGGSGVGVATGSGIGAGSDKGSRAGSGAGSGAALASARTPGNSGIAGRRKAGFLQTPQGKIITGVVAAIGAIILAAIVIPMLGKPQDSNLGPDTPIWLIDTDEPASADSTPAPAEKNVEPSQGPDLPEPAEKT